MCWSPLGNGDISDHSIILEVDVQVEYKKYIQVILIIGLTAVKITLIYDAIIAMNKGLDLEKDLLISSYEGDRWGSLCDSS